MKLGRLAAPVISAIALAAFAGVSPVQAATNDGWSNAQHIATPAPRPQSPGGIASVSCAPGGYCVAFGTYEVTGVPFGADIAYVTTKIGNGPWSKIKPIPGLAALVPGKAPRATAGKIVCPSAGNCSAYGTYLTTFKGPSSSFVVTQKNGVWGRAKAVPALKSMHAAGPPQITTLACKSAGNCVAGGSYKIGSLRSMTSQAFVLSEVRGAWGRVQNPPGLRLGKTIRSEIDSVACPRTGACLALGSQATSLVTTTTAGAGSWSKVRKVPGTGPATTTCAPTECVIAATFSQMTSPGTNIGTYSEKAGVVSKVQLITEPSQDENLPMSIACPRAGRCSMAWTFLPPTQDAVLGFTDTQVNGTWGKPAPMTIAGRPGPINVIIRGFACGGPGDCSATGDVTDENGLSDQAFLVDQIGGVWQPGFLVPGLNKLEHQSDSFGESLSCWSSFHCVAGGVYTLGTQVTSNAFVSVQK